MLDNFLYVLRCCIREIRRKLDPSLPLEAEADVRNGLGRWCEWMTGRHHSDTGVWMPQGEGGLMNRAYMYVHTSATC